MPKPKHPKIIIPMVGEDGNAFSILGRCRKIGRRAGLSEKELDKFSKEAKSGEYDHLLATVMKWFAVE